MKAVLRAELKHPDARVEELHLFKVEQKVFRWVFIPSMCEWDSVDYLTDHIAIKALRVFVETDPSMVGVDLTIRPMDPTPAERAAARIWTHYDTEAYDELKMPLPRASEVEYVAKVIEDETHINGIIDAAQTLIAYQVQRMRQPKPPGLDMAHGGLILGLIEQIEKATGQNFDNIRKMLTKDVDQVKVYSNVPNFPGGGKPQ